MLIKNIETLKATSNEMSELIFSKQSCILKAFVVDSGAEEIIEVAYNEESIILWYLNYQGYTIRLNIPYGDFVKGLIDYDILGDD